MNANPDPVNSDPVDRLPNQRAAIRVMLVDEDRSFRLALRVWLDQFSDVQLVAEAETGTAALGILKRSQSIEANLPLEGMVTDNLGLELADKTSVEPETHPQGQINLVIIDIGLGQFDANQLPGLTLCQRIHARYAHLPILCLSSFAEPIMLAAAQQAGAIGYCPKNLAPIEFANVIRQVGQGQTCWIAVPPQSAWGGLPNPLAPALRHPTLRHPSLSSRSIPRFVTRLGNRWRQVGIRQIDQTLAELFAQLERSALSALDRAILQGRVRELRTARWFVGHLLGNPGSENPGLTHSGAIEPNNPLQPNPFGQGLAAPIGSVHAAPNSTAMQSTAVQSTAMQSTDALANELAVTLSSKQLQDLVFDRVSVRLQGSFDNLTASPLEIDILRQEKKRELAYLTLRKIEDLLNELRYSQIEAELLSDQRSRLLQDLWVSITVDFFGKYYTVQVERNDVLVADRLLADAEMVQIEILDRIPAVVEVLRHLLFLEPLVVDDAAYVPGNPEALSRTSLILENWLLQLTNAVMQPLLNRFAHVEMIKRTFYDRRLLSNREIERFRNDLSWRYRLFRLIQEPKNMFESQYQLLYFSDRGIRQTSIYAPRTAELDQLVGWQYAITLALETRDAIAPRLRSVISFVGNGLVYVLTDVVGRGLGLVGRGILKGIGNAWQDGRFSRK